MMRHGLGSSIILDNTVKSTFKDWITMLSCLVMMGTMVYDHVPPTVTPTTGVTVGRTYAPILVGTYADTWIAAADKLDSGSTVADVNRGFHDAWNATRIKAYDVTVLPVFNLILTEGVEPTPVQRKQVSQLWRDFAKGLKDGK